MKKILLMSLIFTGLIIFTRSEIYACSCPTMGGTLREEMKWQLKDSQAVFSGEVIKITDVPASRDVLVKIRLLESWKESLPDEINIATDRSPGSCGYPFEVGKSYLVFAHRSDEGNLTTGLCLRNRELQKAAEELKILDEIKFSRTKNSSFNQENAEPLITETFFIKYLNLCVCCNNETSDLKILIPPIQRSLSKRGELEVDGRAKTLSVTDEKENIEFVRKIIEQLDKPKKE